MSRRWPCTGNWATPWARPQTWATWGLVALDQGDYAAAKDYHEQALAIDRQLGNPLGEARSPGQLGAGGETKATTRRPRTTWSRRWPCTVNWATPWARP